MHKAEPQQPFVGILSHCANHSTAVEVPITGHNAMLCQCRCNYGPRCRQRNGNRWRSGQGIKGAQYPRIVLG